MQQKTHRPVQFEITGQIRDSLTAWISLAHLQSDQYLFPGRIHDVNQRAKFDEDILFDERYGS